MSLILNIDCSTETASVCLAEKGIELCAVVNEKQKDHAAFLHNAINDICKQTAIELTSIAAIAVAKGPGSYTGLRVAMASAKGLCYALKKPFITVSSLEVMANAAINSQLPNKSNILYCPMIDARRMEVYTALYDSQLKEIESAQSMILDNNSFSEYLQSKTICFFGSGASKFQGILLSKNAAFLQVQGLTASMSQLSYKKFTEKDFDDLVYSEPLYIKEFHPSPDFSSKK